MLLHTHTHTHIHTHTDAVYIYSDCLLPGAGNLAVNKIGLLLTGYKINNKKLSGGDKCGEIHQGYVMKGDCGAG